MLKKLSPLLQIFCKFPIKLEKRRKLFYVIIALIQGKNRHSNFKPLKMEFSNTYAPTQPKKKKKCL